MKDREQLFIFYNSYQHDLEIEATFRPALYFISSAKQSNIINQFLHVKWAIETTWSETRNI